MSEQLFSSPDDMPQEVQETVDVPAAEQSSEETAPKYEPIQKVESTWQQGSKDSEPTTLRATKTTYRLADSTVGKELFLPKMATPTLITPSRRVKPQRDDELTIVLGDAQIGYRGKEPFHDEQAMALAQLAIRELMPDRIIFVGDMLDLAPMSRWEQRGDWANSTQDSIDRYHTFLAQTRSNAPNAEIIAISGNHELRMDKFVRKDAAEVLGLRRANAEKELAVLSLRFLVRMDELGVENVDGYPNATYWLNENLKATHGTNVAKGGSNAAKYLNDGVASGTLYGHTHRVEMAHRTYPTKDGQNTIVAASPGTLARTTGHVPGFRYSVNSQNETVPRAEDWQQGALLVEHGPKSEDVTPVVFHGNTVRLYGKRYELEPVGN